MSIHRKSDGVFERYYVEPQRSTNLDARKLPQPGLPVDGVYFEPEILGGLPDIQEPSTDGFIRPHFGSRFHSSAPSAWARVSRICLGFSGFAANFDVAAVVVVWRDHLVGNGFIRQDHRLGDGLFGHVNEKTLFLKAPERTHVGAERDHRGVGHFV